MPASRLAALLLATAAAAAGIAGCAAPGGPSAGPLDPPPAARANDWRQVATQADRQRIQNWYRSWQDALASARANGHGDDLRREGALIDPLAALPNPHLPPGDYRCRTVKLGARGNSTLAYVAYPFFTCRVAAEQDLFSFTKTTGSQRQVGLIFDDNDRRKIFLGTMMLGDELRAMDYGADAGRDIAGMVERIGAERWRLVMPRPAFESLVDVLEIVPQ